MGEGAPPPPAARTFGRPRAKAAVCAGRPALPGGGRLADSLNANIILHPHGHVQHLNAVINPDPEEPYGTTRSCDTHHVNERQVEHEAMVVIRAHAYRQDTNVMPRVWGPPA